ncbi:MAG: DUF2059 domain-containing protein [Bacteroidota bacterium]|nr:DUF2059 domain-containing protein [Bacteroidota bacterium]
MKKILFLISITLLTVNLSFGQSNNEYKETLKKMFESCGTMDVYKVTIKQIIKISKEQKSNVPNKVWNQIEDEMLMSIDDLVDMLLPVYNKHLSLEDLQKLIEFYQTPIGKKLTAENPKIAQESMIAGQKWGEKLEAKIVSKLLEKGFK